VLVDGEHLGWVGEIHPAVAAEWEFEETLAGFEIDLSAITPRPPKLFKDLVSFPEVREDLAVLVSDQVTAAEILAVIHRAGSPLLAGAEIFDVYRDPERLGAGKVSVAVRLAYRVADRTLTDAEVARQRQFIVNALAQELEGTIRAGE
jgi:phenylalanyl-tRNA synthetase beta chain